MAQGGVSLILPQSITRVGMRLSDLPTPAIVIELSELEGHICGSLNNEVDAWIENFAADAENDETKSILQPGVVFLHCTVVSTSVRDKMDSRFGSGKARSFGALDGAPTVSSLAKDVACESNSPLPLFYLGLGLANHHVAGYYWGRSLGRGAAAPAIGVSVVPRADVLQLLWARRRRVVIAEAPPYLPSAMATNSNDGKRSEWCDFLQCGDCVQLVPRDSTVANLLLRLALSKNTAGSSVPVVGVRREGLPRGADPVVEKVWRGF